MRSVVCRVFETKLFVNDAIISSIENGLLVYLGLTHTDTIETIDKLTHKLINLRIFRDDNDKMNLKFDKDIHQIMIVSQFTLYGDVSNNHRPSFTKAAPKEIAFPLYQRLINNLLDLGINVQTGAFGEHMEIISVYDGPVNLLIEFD